MGSFNDANQVDSDSSGDDSSLCSFCTSDDLSLADDSDDALSPDQCNGDNRLFRPIVSKNWQVSGCFGEQGGTLRKPGSDVLLEIPPGAVKTSAPVTVHAAVCADLEKMHRKIGSQLSTNDEQIVTPLVEYWVEENLNWRFESPVAIRLPHLLPPEFHADNVRVYHIARSNNGQMKLSRVQRRTENANCKEQTSSTVGESDDRWFSVSSQSDYVTVHTHHFSGYVCSYCNTLRTRRKRPQLFARGKGSLIDWQDHQHVDVVAYVWDKRINIADFSEEVGINTKLLSDSVTIDISKKFKKPKLQMSLTDHHPILKHRMRQDGRKPLLAREKTYDLLEKCGCKKCMEKGKMTHMQHNWQMEVPPGHEKQTQVEVQVGITIQDADADADTKDEIPETALSIRMKHRPTSPVHPSTCPLDVVDSSSSVLQSGEGMNSEVCNMQNNQSLHSQGQQRIPPFNGAQNGGVDQRGSIIATMSQYHQDSSGRVTGMETRRFHNVAPSTLSAMNRQGQLLTLEGPDGLDEEYKFVPRKVILEVAKRLGTDGDKNFYLQLGLSNDQFEEAHVKHRESLIGRNTECLTMWCRKTRCADAVDKLKAVLSERGDIVEIIDSILEAEKKATENV